MTSFSQLVESLCAHFTPATGAGAATPASRYVEVAAIAAGHGLPEGASAGGIGATHRAQLESLTREFEQVVSTEGSVCSPASVCSLTALILVALRHLRDPRAQQSGDCLTDRAGRKEKEDSIDFVEAIAERFEACTLRLLRSFPPFPAAVQSAVSYCAAQLVVRGDGSEGGGRLGQQRLLREACDVVAAMRRGRQAAPAASLSSASAALSSDGAALPISAAVEIIAQCASQLVACRPPTLDAASIDPSLMGLGSTSTGSGSGQGEKGRKPPTKKADGGARDDGKRAARQAGNEERGRDAAEPITSPAGNDTSELLPAPHPTAVAALQHTLIECCLQALGSSSGGDRCGDGEGDGSTDSSRIDVRGMGKGDGGEDAVAALCRRILIPLLLMRHNPRGGINGGADITNFESRIEALLVSLGAGTRSSGSSGGNGDGEGEQEMGHSVAECKRRSEAIVIIAALFDFLFRPTDARDFRHSPFLWRLLLQSFWDAMTCVELDAGRRASMQLRSEYLLKRIVDLCKRQQGDTTDAPQTTAWYTEYFPWTWAPAAARKKGRRAELGGSEGSWELFFLVLEALNEYGLHMAIPAMKKLDALLVRLQAQLESPDAAADPASHGALPACWVELLLLKLVTHPNVGVRKVGLRRLWALPLSVLRAFSASFLYGIAFCSAADPRLCADLDRIPVTASFLEPKVAATRSGGADGPSAADDMEARTMPELEPLAQSIDAFYGSLFCRLLRSGAARTSAMLLLFDAVAVKPAKFTTAVLVRLFRHLAKMLFHHAFAEAEGMTDADGDGDATWTVRMILNEEVLRRLSTLMRDTMQENMDLCLDVRIVALVFEALLHFAALAPSTFRAHDLFWRVFCLCGPLGQSGGARLDACGTYGATGAVGASIDPQLLNEKLVLVSRELDATRRNSDRDVDWLVHGLLEPQTLVTRTEVLLRSASSGGGGGGDGDVALSGFAEAAIKAHFFLVGALLRTDAPSDSGVVASLSHLVAQAVTSYRSRVYASDAGLLSALAALVELYHSAVGQASDESGHGEPRHQRAELFSTPCLVEMAATVFTRARVTLEAGLQAAGDGEADLTNPVWHLLHTARWDVVAAAAMVLFQLAIRQDPAGGAAALQAQEEVEWLVAFLSRCAAMYAEKHAVQDGGARVYALIVVARDASRLLQSVLCGLVYCPTAISATANPHEHGADEEIHVQESAAVGCFLTTMGAAAAVDMLERLAGVVPQRMVASAANTSYLSSQSSSSTLAEHFRYVYNAMLILCQRITAHDVASCARACRILQDFGLRQAEECWTNNLACVYDLLHWVVVAAAYEGQQSTEVDCELVLTAMLSHMQDTSAKQFVRVSSLTYNALQEVFPQNPHFVVEKLLAALDADGESDRNTYFVAITASLLVLQDPRANWPVLKEVLLGVAVFFNGNRDGEDNESSLAATEPPLASWPDALRIRYPPTVRMAVVGRALALSTILRCCDLDSTATGGELLVQPLCLALLEMNASDPVVTHEPCMPNSRTHRVRVRLWQLLVLLLPFMPRSLSHVRPIFDALVQHCIPAINMSSVRRYMDVFAIELVKRQLSLHEALATALGQQDIRPQVCGTYILVACHALLHDEERQHSGEREGEPNGPDGESLLFTRLFPLVLQQATSHQHLLRIISHTGIYMLCTARLAHGKSLPRDTQAVFDYIANAPEHAKFRERYASTLFYDTREAASPHSVLCVVRREANNILRESIPAAAFERMRLVETETCCLIGSFYPVERLRARGIGATWRQPPSVPARAATALAVFQEAPYIPHTRRPAEYYVDYTAEAVQVLTSDAQMLMEATGGAGAEDNIQKKITPWWGSEVYNELHPRALHVPSGPAGSQHRTAEATSDAGGMCRQSLIVVGSLLLNPVNIAGLCRCGEIFAVEQIVIPEKKVFEHPHFVATARSAELWIPWAEVAPRDLPAYLDGKRREGYTICGVEQTAGSVSMASYPFPDKAVVVLGSEGQGIPAPLIPMLDVCVEIPQYGLIRSLNVHVTGAIVMYEYTKQHLMCKDAE